MRKRERWDWERMCAEWRDARVSALTAYRRMHNGVDGVEGSGALDICSRTLPCARADAELEFSADWT